MARRIYSVCRARYARLDGGTPADFGLYTAKRSEGDSLPKRCSRIAFCSSSRGTIVVAMETLAMIAPQIWCHAVDTFSTEERALRWMRQPLAELGERTPEDVLLEDRQTEAVEAILARIDYGVYG